MLWHRKLRLPGRAEEKNEQTTGHQDYGEDIAAQNAPRRTALRRIEIMLLRQPAAGGESCRAGFFFISVWQ